MPDILNTKKPFQMSSPRPQVYKNLIVEAVLLVVGLALFLNFLVLPKKSAVAEKHQQLTELTSEYENISKNKQDLGLLVQEMKAAKKDLALLDSTLPLSSRITTVHVLLDSLVSSSGLTLANIQTDTTDDMIAAGDEAMIKNPYQGKRVLKTLTVNLSVTGNMDQFLKFLNSLESNARLVDVKSISITKGNTQNNTTFNLALKTYFFGLVGADSATTPDPAAPAQ